MLDAAAMEITGRPLGLDEQIIRKALDPYENVRVRSVIGGPAPDEVRRMIDARNAVLAEDQDRLEHRRRQLAQAAQGLRDAVAAVLNR